MARFDVYRNPGRNRDTIPYLLEVQSNVISGLASRLVIPLRTLHGFDALSLPTDLFPLIEFDSIEHFLDTPQMAAIPAAELKTRIGTLQSRQADIQTALDRVFGAY
ncbi:CcdB family protein [Janthinobacterium aquaticum]|uniref:CcdB family protein n=1 Tax=Janthinobacterium sp. FT58W TaxID=2654254 RepID=UPI00186B440C|nr:CcdB family protein [Janthinobacterium sp. FT58W]